jgi:hypothetical protein
LGLTNNRSAVLSWSALLKTSQAPGHLLAVRTPNRPANAVQHFRLKSNTSQPPILSLHFTMSLVTRKLRIDLTSEVEHCAVCSIELGKGSGKAGLVYVLKDCRCVSLSLSISYDFINCNKVICGLCVQFPSTAPFLPCQHADHLGLGWQRPLRLYNLKCAICLEPYGSARVTLVCGKFTPSTAVLADS